MNVGIFIKALHPESGGGYIFQEEVLKSLCELSEQTRHSFVIFFSGKKEDLPLELCRANITVVPSRYNWYRKILSGLSATHIGRDIQNIFRRNISSISPSLIKKYRIEFFWFPTSHFLGVVDVPYMTTVWDLQHRLQPWFPEVSAGGEWIFREEYYRNVLQRATYVIAGTNAGKEEIMRFYGVSPERVKLLPHPTPVFSFAKKIGKDSTILVKLGLKPGYLFYPAQFWPHKNHYVLIKAMEHLKKKFNVKIDLVLTGSDKGNRPYIEELATQSALRDQIHFAGFVSQQDLQSLYQHALALVYPTFFGPENLPPLEAFALGCPVIASRVSGAEEQLSDAPLLFDPSDHTQLAKHIKLLVDKKGVSAKLIKKGKERARQWTCKDFVQGVFSILDEFEAIRKSWQTPQ